MVEERNNDPAILRMCLPCHSEDPNQSALRPYPGRDTGWSFILQLGSPLEQILEKSSPGAANQAIEHA